MQSVNEQLLTDKLKNLLKISSLRQSLGHMHVMSNKLIRLSS